MLTLLCLSFLLSSNAAQSYTDSQIKDLKASADSAYLTEEYDKAIGLYSEILSQGQSSKVAYNLANAYYRKGQWAKSILWYERTLILNPGDADAAYNLDMARTNTVDRIEPVESFFLVNIWQRIINHNSVDGWATMAIACFVIAFICLLVYFFTSNVRIKRISFYISILMFVFVILCNIFAWSLNNRLNAFSGAIIMQPSVKVSNTPSESSVSHFVLHAGTRVDIEDTSIKGWANIHVSDGREGWIPVGSYEVIKLSDRVGTIN